MADRPDELPHGHGASYKRGVADGVTGAEPNEGGQPNGHQASYRAGYEAGKEESSRVSTIVKR